MCGGNTCPFPAKLVTHNRIVAINGVDKWSSYHESYYGPTIVCGGNTCPFLAKLATYDRCVVVANGHLIIAVCEIQPFLAKLATYDRCVVVANGHIMTSVVAISRQIRCSGDKLSYYDQKGTYNMSISCKISHSQ